MLIDHEPESSNQHIFSCNSINNIKFKNILVVGAGGIGCELLKSLVQSGFKNISIVDMDKIEKSNLNRQFLFDKNCIGNYKSQMARDSILKYKKFDKELQINSYIGNIKDKTQFDIEFFKKFDIILNALDNLDARTYINQICINNKIPLVNSGTEGYLGYAASYVRDITPCYNCAPKNKKKAIPICSIRSKPEKIEHCVAWAKSLFELLFTDNTNGNLLEDYKIDPLDSIKNFQNYFYFNIKKEKVRERQLSLYKIDMTSNSIREIDISQIIQYEFVDIYSDEMEKEYDEFNRNVVRYDDDVAMSTDLQKLIFILIRSNERLQNFIIQNHQNKFDKFDKENKDIVNFVYAATCLRSINFSILPESRFKIKEIAGNIIPAIASTNAIIAGIQTIETMKALNGQYDLLKTVNYNKDKKIASILCKEDYKNEGCQVCSKSALNKNSNRISIEFNFERFTLAELLSVLENDLKLYNVTISHKNNLVYESEEGLEQEEKDYYDALKRRSIISFNLNTKDELKISNEKMGIILNVINDERYLDEMYKILGEVDLNYDEEIEKDEKSYYPNANGNDKDNEEMVLIDDDENEIYPNTKDIKDHNITPMFIKRKRHATSDSLQPEIHNFYNPLNQFIPSDILKKRKHENDELVYLYDDVNDDSMINLDEY